MEKGTIYPGLYLAEESDARTVVPTLCAHGYYVILLRGRSAENETRFGRHYYDYSDAMLTCCRPERCPEALYLNASLYCRWIIAFSPRLFEGMASEKEMADYSFFAYHPEEALHLSLDEANTLIGCVNDIRTELQHVRDHCTNSIIVRHIRRILDYTTRFYERQFITRELAVDSIFACYEALIDRYMADGKLQMQGLPDTACCADALHLSETYFNDLLKFRTGYAHDCYVQIKRVELAKKRLTGSSDSIHRIATELGFPSASYFSYLFKKLTGTAPDKYRTLN